MKRVFFSLLFAASVICGCADGNKKLHVKIDIVDWGDSLVALIGQQEQTFTGKQGKFEFDLELNEVTEVVFVEPTVLRGETSDVRYYRVPAVPGEEMLLQATARGHYDVLGTGFYADFHKVDMMNDEAVKDLQACTQKVYEMRANGVGQDSLRHFLDNTYRPILDQYQDKLLQYVREHPTEEAAVTLIKYFENLERANQALQALSPEVREGRMKPLWQSAIEMMQMQAQQEEEAAKASKKQAAGLEAPDFTLNDINGKPLSLSSLRGKYVIIDFWGSWCIWCIKGFPQMKEYYEKYKGKFEILGVACNDKEDKWKEAVKKYELPWLQVYCPEGSSVPGDYAIQGFPTKIIVGPDGKIVQAIIGEDPSFYSLLDQLFGQ